MDAQPDISTGTLLGLESGATLEITNSYPIPLFAQTHNIHHTESSVVL